jgi:hypothetical protein
VDFSSRSSITDVWSGFPQTLLFSGRESCIEHPLQIVGLEYWGNAMADFPGLLNSARMYYKLKAPPAEREHITAISFLDWLDEQQPGGIFTAEEEAELRDADRWIRSVPVA